MVQRAFVFALGLTVLAAIGCGSSSESATGSAAVDAARLTAADREPGQWMSHGRTYGEQRFSPLDQINTETVGRLDLAWFADLDTRRGQEATPLVVDGVLYVSTAWSKVKAYDAATGKPLWAYDPEVPGEWAVQACCDVVNRGVAVWDGKVFVGSLDGRLIALDAATGRELWDVNTVDRTKPYTITGAPRVVKGKVLIGNGGAEFGVRGYVSAYDAATGALAWRFYTVPGDPAKGFESPILKIAAQTWSGEWWTLGGGGTVWDSMAYDPELDLLFIGVGNGSPWNHLIRSEGKGDNLFLASIVALDPDDGSYVWHYQTSPGETWDHTATQHIIVADLPLNGATRRVVMQAPKNGFFYVLDAKTGALISAKNFTDISWATHVDMKTGRPVETANARFYKTGRPFVSRQNPNGAHTWHPMSFSPDTGLVYIPIHMQDYTFAHEPAFTPSPLTTNLGIRRSTAPADPNARAAATRATVASVGGPLIAWDPVSQREVWRVEREGAANGGVLSTAGGLVFQGTGAGAFAALNARSGTELWSAQTQTGVIAAPISYTVAGMQYVAVMVGTGGSWAMSGSQANARGNGLPNISRLLVYALGGTAKLPPAEPRPPRPLAPPPATAAADIVARGEAEYPDLLRQVSRPRERRELRHSAGSALQRDTAVERGVGRRRPKRGVGAERDGLVRTRSRREQSGRHSRLRHRASECRPASACFRHSIEGHDLHHRAIREARYQTLNVPGLAPDLTIARCAREITVAGSRAGGILVKPLFLIPRPGSLVMACLWLATIATTSRTPALVAQGSDAKTLKNPVAINAKSIEAGRRSYARWCAPCHGIGAKGDGPKPPEGSKPANLTDDQWDHGSTDGEIFVAIRDGIGPKFDMDSWNSRLPAQEIWSMVNYIRSLNPKTAQTP